MHGCDVGGKMRKVLLALMAIIMLGSSALAQAENIICWFPPGWKIKKIRAKMITEVLSEKSGLVIEPKVAESYTFILNSFTGKEHALVYTGSFIQAIIATRDLGVPLVQAVNGTEAYGSWMVLPKDGDPEAILKKQAGEVAYAIGASAGESGAKAATQGAANFPTRNHGATITAVTTGKAPAGFVKSWWWRAKKDKYPDLKSYQLPGISDEKNPDNILTASKGLSKEDQEKIKQAALASGAVFGAQKMVEFDAKSLKFSLWLMEQGHIDPKTYSW